MKIRSLIATCLFAAVSAGCNTVRIIDHSGGMNYYDGAFEPFFGTGADTKNITTSMMYGATFGRDVKFVSAAPNTDKYGFHVVVAFNVSDPLSVADICENAAQVKSDSSRRTTAMQGVFCQGGYPLSYASGYVSDLTGPGDPRFRQLVRAVTLAMIPAYDDYKFSGFSPL